MQVYDLSNCSVLLDDTDIAVKAELVLPNDICLPSVLCFSCSAKVCLNTKNSYHLYEQYLTRKRVSDAVHVLQNPDYVTRQSYG